ncbi:MAG: DNA polymerase III subunit beta [Coriobacteriia bacterium]|nr:DNA polymerase III subunit beta [Coriobacteriia bacterium]
MRFSINQAELRDALAVVSKGSSTRSTLSILAGVYLRAEDSELVLQATDLELSIRLAVPALVDEPGETVAPAKLLTDIVKTLPDQAVTVETTEAGMNVFCGSTTFALKTLNPTDFPSFPETYADKEASFPFNTFSNMVKSVAKDVSKDETRAILTGVLISQTGSELKMVATDSYRLAVASTTLEHSIEGEFEAVVAGPFLSEIAALPSSSELITIALSENQVIVSYRGTTFINRRIEGTFPNYRQLIGGERTTRVELDVQSFVAAVRRVSLLSNKVSPIQVSVDAEAGVVTCMTSSQDVGNAQEALEGTVEGETVSIAFNHQFLLDGLASVKTDHVYVDLAGSMRPGILRSTEEDFLYLIMPVRV